MHICFLAIDFHSLHGGGGIASYLSVLAPYLVRCGHRVTVLSLGRKAERRVEDGIQIIEVPHANLHWYLYRLLFFANSWCLPYREIEWSHALWTAFDKLSQADPVDIVESSEIGNWFYRAAVHPPLVIRTHGSTWAMSQSVEPTFSPGTWLDRVMERQSIRRARVISTVSRYQMHALATELGARHPPIVTIHNPFNADLFPVRTAGTPTRPLVLYTGRIQRCKGSLVLLEAIPRVQQQIPDVEFVLAGGRHSSISQRELNQALVPLQPLIARNQVRLLGHVPWQDLVGWYQQARVFVMPSYYESFGISVAEAMACGLPIVATTAGGLPELVDDGSTGLLVEPGSSTALADALIRLLQDEALANQMGELGAQRVRERFGVDQLAHQTLDLYESIVAGKSLDKTL